MAGNSGHSGANSGRRDIQLFPTAAPTGAAVDVRTGAAVDVRTGAAVDVRTGAAVGKSRMSGVTRHPQS
jgi:hypothetical protein